MWTRNKIMKIRQRSKHLYCQWKAEKYNKLESGYWYKNKNNFDIICRSTHLMNFGFLNLFKYALQTHSLSFFFFFHIPTAKWFIQNTKETNFMRLYLLYTSVNLNSRISRGQWKSHCHWIRSETTMLQCFRLIYQI